MANPEGKGGFQHNMDNRTTDGANHWTKFSTIYNKILEHKDIDDFIPQTVREKICLNRVRAAQMELTDKDDMIFLKAGESLENRLDGTPKQIVEQTHIGDNPFVEAIKATAKKRAEEGK